jgi:imidazolonepropionase-like amidohydrolase
VTPPPWYDRYVLRQAFVLDAGGSFSGPLDVAVEGQQIRAVGSGLHGGGATSFDFQGCFLLPGLFDCHDHLALSSLDLAEAVATPLTAWALEAAANARRTLEAGVTFVRDLGGADAGMRTPSPAATCPAPR